MPSVGGLENWIAACLLLGLRIGPLIVSAPPFTLIRIPVAFRVLFALALAILMVSARPDGMAGVSADPAFFIPAAILELMLGLLLALMFQLSFAALYLAGRTLDVQAGFGLALLIDPTSRTQTPLIGTIYVYATGAIFFAMNGHHDLFAILAASVEAVPPGMAAFPDGPSVIYGFLSLIFLAGFGVAGIVVLTLFLTDLAVALLTRTVPQMNALILGFQVKTIILLLVLALTSGLAAAMMARLMTLTLDYLPRLF